jgi:pSer/pThr/pTyr-binding forkhead associated (FHA) protein
VNLIQRSTPLIIGRDPRSDVVIKSETVSKRHLKIFPKGDRFFIVDLGSTNGTYVNREKITETLVTPENIVQLGKRGNIKLIFKK